MARHCLTATLLLLVMGQVAPLRAQAPAQPKEKEPLLRLEAGGPATDVTALAFAPDGQTLYAAGWDKVVRVWKRDETGAFVPQRTSYRVPIGPGLRGAINTLALSADGRWLAVGGLGVFRDQANFQLPGLVVPSAAMTPAMRQDEGTIFVFPTAKPGEVRELRGHRGPVLSLAFVAQAAGQAPALVSAGRDWDEKKQGYAGAVRLWELAKPAGKDIAVAEFTALPDPGAGLPGLAAWRTGPGAKQVRVALAWDDGTFYKGGKLRLWDADRGRVLDSGNQEGSFNNTVAYVPDQKLLLTGSWGRKDYKGWLGKWELAPDQPPQASRLVAAAFLPHEGKTVFFPRALALLSARGDGKLDCAAVVLRVQPGQEYRLLLLRLAQPRNYALAEAMPLWKGGRLPSLATAPNGTHLAVAGASDHAIQVYAVADLLKGAAAPQVLRSIGAQVGYAGFVRKGKQLGLVLSERPKAVVGSEPRAFQAGDMVFDFLGRRLRSDLAGWAPDAPAPAGWTHTQAKAPAGGARPPTIQVRSPDGKVTTVELPPQQVITDHALLTPRPPLNLPLLAVASVNGDEPTLALYQAASGELLCQFAGHLGAIRSLAFSGDGRFLVSAAGDQTVCLWGLTHFEKFVGKYGQLRGLVVQEKGKRLVVAAVAPDSPARGLLKEGEAIVGLMVGGKLKPLASPPEFYLALLSQVPGQKATLRLGGKGDVQVPVSQAVLNRTPLAILFLTHGDRAEGREWLAWNPLGPYDSSTPKMARAFGWHFNPSKPGQPAQFAPADTARAQERRVGLLKHLLARGDLPPALEDYEKEQKAKPLPPPEMTLGVDDLDRRVIRKPQSTLRLRVTGPVASVQWRLDDGPFRPFAEQAREDGAASFAQPLAWKRGDHRIQVRVRPRKESPQEFTRELAVRYVPPPPEIVARGTAANARPGQPLQVAREEFPLEATVRPGVPGEKVRVELYHQHDRLNMLAAAAEVNQKVRLQPGKNRLAVIAVASDALPNTAAAETGRLEFEVVYTPPKPPEVVPAPLIALDAVVPLLGGAEPGQSQEIVPGRAVVVAVPRIRLVGTIKGAKALASAQQEHGGKAGALAGFKPGASTDFPIAETLILQPGIQKIVLRARTATSKQAEQVLTLEYRPALPRAELTATPAGPVFYDEGKGPPEITLSGRLLAPRDPAPPGVTITATVLLNDKEIPAEIDKDGRTWSARVRLVPKQDRFQVKLSNTWRQEVFGDLQLSYLRPPRGLRATVPAQTDAAILDLSAQMDSALPLVAPSVRATVTSSGLFGVRAAEMSGAVVTAPAAPGQPWTVRLKVPLEPGRNDLRLEAANAEGVTRVPGAWTVTYAPPKPLPAPPQVTLLQPKATAATSDFSLKVSRPRFPIRFRVRSAAPLQRVAVKVRQEGQPPEEKLINAASARAVGDGFELTADQDLQLAPGLTTVLVEARNEGGTGASPALLVQYVPPPVRLVLDGFEPQDGTAPLSPITEGLDGKLTCAAPGKARLWLRGRVIWDQADARLGAKRLVSVYVNGAQQWRGELGPAPDGATERDFKAAILLNRKTGNLIEIDLPGLELPDYTVRKFAVDCRQPQPEQWLHVQIISPSEPDEGKLIKQVLETLQATNYAPLKEEFKRPGFAHARLYRPLIEDVDQDLVAYRLLTIKRQIAQRARDGWPNDVVLIYYVGGEAVDPTGRLVALTQGQPPRPLITRAHLEQAFADMLGVKVLLLDVARDKAGATGDAVRREVSRWLDGPTRHAWLRATWLGAGAMPADARLLAALRVALPLAGRLGDLPLGLSQRFRVLTERYGALRADWYLPPPLLGLVVNEHQ